MASKQRSKAEGTRYAAYKTEQRWAKNRRKKLERLAKVHPNNEQITAALKNISYRRTTPKSQVWSKSDIAIAKLIKEFEGKFDAKKEFEKEHVVFGNKLHVPSAVTKESHSPRGFYSLGTRAHDKQGASVWA